VTSDGRLFRRRAAATGNTSTMFNNIYSLSLYKSRCTEEQKTAVHVLNNNSDKKHNKHASKSDVGKYPTAFPCIYVLASINV